MIPGGTVQAKLANILASLGAKATICERPDGYRYLEVRCPPGLERTVHQLLVHHWDDFGLDDALTPPISPLQVEGVLLHPEEITPSIRARQAAGEIVLVAFSGIYQVIELGGVHS